MTLTEICHVNIMFLFQRVPLCMCSWLRRSNLRDQQRRLPKRSMPERGNMYRRRGSVHVPVPTGVLRRSLRAEHWRVLRQPVHQQRHLCGRHKPVFLPVLRGLQGRRLWGERGWVCGQTLSERRGLWRQDCGLWMHVSKIVYWIIQKTS